MPPIATEFTRHDELTRCATNRHVQCSTEPHSLDHLVGAHEDRFRDRNPKDFRGPKVHDHIKSRLGAG